jgi:hypothetical protein
MMFCLQCVSIIFLGIMAGCGYEPAPRGASDPKASLEAAGFSVQILPEETEYAKAYADVLRKSTSHLAREALIVSCYLRTLHVQMGAARWDVYEYPSSRAADAARAYSDRHLPVMPDENADLAAAVISVGRFVVRSLPSVDTDGIVRALQGERSNNRAE